MAGKSNAKRSRTRRQGEPVLPKSPELLRRLRDEGGSGRTARIFWAREQMMRNHPGDWGSPDELRDFLQSGTASQGLIDEFVGLCGPLPAD